VSLPLLIDALTQQTESIVLRGLDDEIVFAENSTSVRPPEFAALFDLLENRSLARPASLVALVAFECLICAPLSHFHRVRCSLVPLIAANFSCG
jgi:hypothetical protein